MAQKPSLPKGTRDFSPTEVAKRSYIMNTIRTQFKHFGFNPIETPSFENSATLMGKYGEEGDRLIFKILNSGDYLKDLRKNWSKAGVIINNFFIFIDGLFEASSLNDRWDRLINSGIETFFQGSKDSENVFNYVTNNKEKIIEVNSRYESFKKDEKAIQKQEVFIDFFENYINSNINNSSNSTSLISEKALRYDLTVPFARYVVQHQNDIEFPFKRFQIQPVWRADRPQKGRFREFFQCDADVVGSASLWQEVEFIQLYDAVFSDLGLNGVTIKMNNRKILSGIAEVIGEKDKLIDFTVALDKLDKIGEDGVKNEMLNKGISTEAIQKVAPLFSFKGSFSEKLVQLEGLLQGSEEGLKGVEELSFIIKTIETLGLQTATLDLDVTLARGLNYYTGAIFEVAAPENVKMGSIGGGGRYDDLTGIFGLKNVSGVGISFGLDRIYLVLEELDLFPTEVAQSTQVFFINFGNEEALYAYQTIKKLRSQGISAEIYPDAAKMKKQMNYANKRAFPFVVLAGTDEAEKGEYTLKNMQTGEQETVDFKTLLAKVQ